MSKKENKINWLRDFAKYNISQIIYECHTVERERPTWKVILRILKELNNGIYSVSYTHLDVYKRQIISDIAK